MRSFFSRIKNLFDQEFDGRYLALIIRATFEEDPRPLLQFIKESGSRCEIDLRRLGNYYLEIEHSIGQGSRADLALFNQDASRPILLIELKFEDKFHKSHESEDKDQLGNYLRQCKLDACDFLVITKDVLAPDQIHALNRTSFAKHAYWGDFAHVLAMSNVSSSKLLLDYLRELGVVMQQVDNRALYSFLHRMLLPWGGSGRQANKTSFPKGPAQVTALLENLRLVERRLSTRFFPESTRGATIDYQIVPRYNVASIIKTAQKESGDDIKNFAPYRHFRKGGYLRIFVRSPFNRHNLQYGFDINVDKDGEDAETGKFSINTFAEIWGSTFIRDVDGWRGHDEIKWLSDSVQDKFSPKDGPPRLEDWALLLLKQVRSVCKTAAEQQLCTSKEIRATLKRIAKD